MPQPPHPGHPLARRVRTALAVVILGVMSMEIALLSVEAARQIDRQSSAGSDNMQWTLSQVDIELLALIVALDDTVIRPSTLPEVRTRFDVFYSRLQILKDGSAFTTLRKDPDFVASFDRLNAFVTQTIPQIDAPDPDLAATLPDIRNRARAILPDARQITLTGVTLFAQHTDARREEVKSTLIDLAFMTLVLVTALGAMLVRVLRLDRVNQVKAAEIAETLTRLDAVVATSLDAVITLDDHGQITEFNQAAVQTFGFAREEALGQPLTLLIPTTADGRSQLPPRSHKLEVSQRRRRVTARHRLGHDFPAEVSLASARAGAGWVHVVFLRDLSQQLAAEQALVKARDDALAGEKAKADLLVVMSHEIRTPLNGMIGTMDLLDSTALAPHQREYLRIMAASGRLLMHHVNDVLDIARLDSGKAALSLVPVDLAELVREVIENQTPSSKANGNELTFIPAPDGHSRVLADPAMLRQVLLNLVGNAVKFTHHGTITIEVAHLSSHGPTEITVRDTGVGIAPEDLSRIFEDFVTLDTSYARRAAGTGLGLGIVHRIVARMGGKITVNSEPGQGSIFRVSLPLTVLEDTLPQPGLAPDGGITPALTVLVVEDNDFNRLIVRDMLLADHHAVTEAQDGLEGVRLAAAQRFDLILMDISMPGIDGLQAAERIRQGNGASRDTPIVALTAHALHDETTRFRAAGMTDVLVKPITRETLRAVLAGLPRTAAPEPAKGPQDQVLIEWPTLAELRASLGAAKADALVARFLTETEQRMSVLVQRAQDRDADAELISAIHLMTGTAALFGATRLHAQLTMIEDLCKTGRKDEARAAVPALADLWQQTAEAYRRIGSLAQASSLR